MISSPMSARTKSFSKFKVQIYSSEQKGNKSLYKCSLGGKKLLKINKSDIGIYTEAS